MTSQILLCTDLDRTLLPNGSEKESPGARALFSQLAARQEVTLAYVTGRHWALVEEAMLDYDLPCPDYVIGDVGATIYSLSKNASKNPQCWTAWEEKIALDWTGHTSSDLRRWFEDLPELQLQAEEKQNTFKLSYDLPMETNENRLIRIMRERLTSRGVKATFVTSVDEPKQIRLLDVLPAGASKYHAVDFLMRALGFSIRQTVFAGDSGNDLEVLTSGIPSVLVANSTAEVRETALSQSEKKGTAHALYLAKEGFMGMNGNYSAGILEGVAHYLPETKTWLNLEK